MCQARYRYTQRRRYPFFRVGFIEKVELFPETQNQFYGSSTLLGDIQANFVRGTDGRIESMVLRLALNTLRLDKISQADD